MNIVEHIMQCQCASCSRKFCRPIVYAAHYPPIDPRFPGHVIRHGPHGWICHNYHGPEKFYSGQADGGQLGMFEED